jgi:two-component system LytT family sensor kinase
MARVAPPGTGLIVDLLGFLTGAVLYVMLVAMVWRERVVEGMPLFARRGRLPLLTGVCGLLWNLGALASFATQVAGRGKPVPIVIGIAFSALGFLPAVVVHSLLEGRETAAGRRLSRLTIATAYSLSAAAAAMLVSTALEGSAAPSRPALWLLTGGFTVLTAVLLLITREQPIGRRGVWVAALSIFAVSALHFGRHVGNESWWVDLIGHHASLLLALAILHQDYRFALADLFLKNAIALLLFMGISLAALSTAMGPLMRWQGPGGVLDPSAAVVFLVLWMGTALTFPLLRRLSGRLVDRVVLRRPDYDVTLSELARGLESADSDETVAVEVTAAARVALGVSEARTIGDPVSENDRRVVITGPELKSWVSDMACALLLRLRTVEPPHIAIALGPLAAGRRLLSDDVRLFEAIARLAARRIDSLRVAQERLARNLREQQMQRLATEAELRALRAQLNPHFLFNALTTIGYLIQNAPPRALETLLRLTSLLRGVLRRSSAEFTTLGEELDLVTSYLDIERARYEERLHVAIDVSPGARQSMIPTLLLQPLVENAVKHGIAPLRAGGAVRIAACEREGLLHIVIEDSGVGFDPAFARTGSGVGLRSVAERLRAHYADAASLHIHSATGEGASIEIDLPLTVSSHLRRRVG